MYLSVVHLPMCLLKYTHLEARGRHWISFFITLHLISIKQNLSLNLNLAGYYQATTIFLSLFPTVLTLQGYIAMLFFHVSARNKLKHSTEPSQLISLFLSLIFITFSSLNCL